MLLRPDKIRKRSVGDADTGSVSRMSRHYRLDKGQGTGADAAPSHPSIKRNWPRLDHLIRSIKHSSHHELVIWERTILLQLHYLHIVH